MDVKTAGHVTRQVPLPGNPRDGSSPYKRQSISPPVNVAVAASRGAYTYLHPDAGRYGPNIHPPPPPPPASYGSPQLYRDANIYQTGERLTVVDSSGGGSELQPSYRETNEHPASGASGSQSGGGYSQSSAAAAAAAAVIAGRRRPSLLPPSDYNNAINRDRERYLDNYSSSYYERESAVNASGVMPAHAYSMMMSHHGAPPLEATSDHLIVKRPRLTIMGNEQKQDTHRMLGIDTTDMKREPAYNPQVEAISPTLPMDDYHQDSSPHRASRDDLLQQISKVDREIAKVESQILKLKKKQQELEMAAAKPENNKRESAETNSQETTKHLSMAQIIYAENRKKSHEAHQMLSKLGPKVDLPLYNQPFDTGCYHENKKKYLTFKKKLIAYFKKRQQERQVREKYLTDTYNQLLQQWQKKLERLENNVKKKGKELKIREFYEKQFPELKKQREDKERFSRVGTRIRSDAELEEIMDGLQEQELEDKKMRSYAVVPPILLDPRQRRLAFQNENSLVEEAMADYKERQLLNIWTRQEKEIFKEKYLQHPKNFCLIASYLERKSVADCVQYYYLTKKNENYKQLLRKHSVRKKRFNKPNQTASQPPPSQQSGVMTRQGTSTAQADESSRSLLPSTSSATPITSTQTGSNSSNNSTSTSTSSSNSCSNNNSNNNSGFSGNNAANSGSTASSIPGGESLSADTSKCEQKEQSQDGCENSEKCDSKDPDSEKPVTKDEEDTGDEQSDENEGTPEVQGRALGDPHSCAVCKTLLEHYGMSRPLSKNNCYQYGMKEDEVTPDMRVCSFCHCRSVRSRYTHCPIKSCRTPKRKVKRLRPLPGKWAELPPEIKDPIIQDLQIGPEVTKCCSACYNRIERRLGANASSNEINVSSVSEGAENSSWSEDEIELAKRALKDHGLNWFKVSALVATKTETQCKNFYFHYKRKLGLSALVLDKHENELGDKVPPTVTDEEESGESTSSCEDFHAPYQDGSDTASAPSPNSKGFDEDGKKGFKDPSSTPKIPANYIDEAVSLQESKDLSASRGSLKSVTDYDSSATVSADEGPSQLDNEPAVSMLNKGDPRHLSNASRDDANSQNSAPSFLDESRVKSLLTQASTVRPDNQQGNMYINMHHVDSSSKGCAMPERVELDTGEHIFTKTVRDLIDQAIDTSFPDGSSSNGPLATQSSSSGIPNIHDILKRSEKPAGMLKSRNKEYNRETIEMVNATSQQQQQSLPPSSVNAPMLHSDAVNLRMSSSHLQHHQLPSRHSSIQPPGQFIQHPTLSQQSPIPSHHMSSQSSSGHQSLQTSSRIHHGYPISSSSGGGSANTGQSVMLARESLPTVNLYVPEDTEQFKAEDLSIKKDRSREAEYNRTPSSSTFRSPPVVQKSHNDMMRHSVPQSPTQPTAPPAQHLLRHNERMLGAPPPAHSNQYNRSNDMPPHLGDPRDSYYSIRQMEQRTKSPSTFPPDRVSSQSQHIPPPSSQQQCPRPMSPHVSYMMGCSPPLKGQSLKGSNGSMVNAPPPPPLVTSSKHNTPSPKMSNKQDKMMASGSITQGTPVNQSNLLPGAGGLLGMPPHAGGRYEDFIHHSSSSSSTSKDVGGSITLGTPVQHESVVNKRLPEQPSSASQVSGMMNEQGPRNVLMMAEGLKAPPPPPHGYDPYYHRRVSPPSGYSYSNYPQYPRPPFATESQISSRQTIITDYYLSQQMQMRRGSSGNGEKDKEARMSPRIPRDCSPQSNAVLVDHRMHPLYSYPPQPGLPPGAYIQHPDARMSQQQPPPNRHSGSPIGSLHDGHEQSPMAHSISPSGEPLPHLWPRGSTNSPTMATPPPPPSVLQQPQQQQRGVIRSTVSCNSSTMPKVKSNVGVIQSPKSSSPRSADMDAYGTPKGTSSPRHPYTHGQEAFGALVDVAIAQSLPKDVSKHHQNSPTHIAVPQGAFHDLRNVMPNIREEKINSTHKGNIYYDERRGPPPPPPPQPLKERHKYDIGQKMDTINMEERVRKISGMFTADEPPPSHPGMMPASFVRPEYGSRVDAERMRMMHYQKGPPPSSSSHQPPVSSPHQPPLSQSRDSHSIDVDDGSPPAPPPSHLQHHQHHSSSHHQSPSHRGPPPLPMNEQRRPSPPQDLSSDSRRATPFAYSSRASNSQNFRQLECDPSKLLFDVLEKDQPKELLPSSDKPQTLTAATLIDAIISHQINKVTTSPCPKRRSGANESTQQSKNYRISPDASNMNAEGRMSPYKMQRVGNYSGGVPKQKEELVVTLDDSPMAADRDHDIQSQPPPTSHPMCNTNAVMRGTSPGSPYVNSERPTSRGRTPQPSSSPAAGLTTQRNTTLKEHIDAIITNDYQMDSAHAHYSRNVDGRPPSGVPEMSERSSSSVQPSTRSASPDEHTSYPNWKLRKALQQSKEHQREVQQQEQRQSPSENIRSRATPTSVSPLPPRSKDMSSKGNPTSVSSLMVHPPTSQQQQQQQPASSLINYQVEPISPPSNFAPDSNLGEASSTTSLASVQSSSSSWITNPKITSLLTTNRRMYQPPDSSDATTPQSGLGRPHQTDISPFEKYVKHKIVEEMRKDSEETSAKAPLEARGSQQPPTNSPRVDDRNNVWSVEKEHAAGGLKYRASELNDSMTAAMFPGPASQYVPGAIYHPHPHIHHQMETVSPASSTMGPTSSSRGGDIPRPPFKRTFEVMEAVGSSERSGNAGSSSSNTRSRSISPSSSEVEDIKRKRYRLGDSSGNGNNSGAHSTPESSTEWSHQMLVPESSEGMHRSGSNMGGNSHVGSGGAREPQQPSSSDHQTNVGSGSMPSSTGTSTGTGFRAGFTSSTSSSPDHPQPSRKEIEEEGEAQSTGTGLNGQPSRMSGSHHSSSKSGNSSYEGKSGLWDNEVTSGKDEKSVSQMADSPLSGDMVIDESAAIDSATSSKLEPVSPPPQEGISTSEQEDSYTLVSGVGRLTSNSSNSSSSAGGGDHVADPNHSVTSSHGGETRSSPVGATSNNSGNNNAIGVGGGASGSGGNSSSSVGVTVGSSYQNSISSTVPTSYPNSSALVNNISGVSTTYTYPYSALSVRSLAAAVVNSSPTSPSPVVSTPSSSSNQAPNAPPTQQQQPNQSLTSSTSRSNSPVSASREVPSLLMSSQYEPLSDED